MRRGLVLLILASTLAGCGGGASEPTLADATQRTTADGSAAFQLTIEALVGGNPVLATETGTVSFDSRRAHLYKLVPGGGLPQEIVIDGPVVYSNANVEAAMHDTTIPPWTTPRHPAAERESSVAQPARRARPTSAPSPTSPMASRARRSARLGGGDRRRATRSVPRLRRPSPRRRAGARGPARRPRPDAPRRLSREVVRGRVLARRATAVSAAFTSSTGRPAGTLISLDGRFSLFGSNVDLTLPAADKIKDITP